MCIIYVVLENSLSKITVDIFRSLWILFCFIFELIYQVSKNDLTAMILLKLNYV